MTREKLRKEIELELERNRVAIAQADAHLREFNRQAAIRAITTEQVFRELREAVRRR